MRVPRLHLLLVLSFLASLALTFPIASQPVPSGRIVRDSHLHTQSAPTMSGTITHLGSYKTSGSAVRVQVVSNLAYVPGSGVDVIDVTNPMSPTLYAHYSSRGCCLDIQVVDSLAYLPYRDNFNQKALQIVDLQDPRSPQLLGSVTTNNFYEFAGGGGFAYVDEGGVLVTIDVRDPRNPLVRSRLDLSNVDIVRGMTVVDNVVYVVGQNAPEQSEFALRIVDVSDPDRPLLRGTLDAAVGVPAALAVTNGMAYVPVVTTGRHKSELRIIDVHDPDRPTAIHTSGILPALDIEVAGRLAYLAYSYFPGAGIEVLDVGNPTAPTRIASGGETREIVDIEVVGNRIYVAAEAEGLQILEVTFVNQAFLPVVVR